MPVKTIEISSLMHELEAEVRARVGSKLILNCVLGASSLYIDTDPLMLRKVLSDMLDNSIKFTEHGSITFGYDISDDELYFYVKDTGIGVPRELQEAIFDGSTGNIGTLVTDDRIIKSMGGEMGVDSRGSGKGSTFWFTIPNTQITNAEPQAPAQPTIPEQPVNTHVQSTVQQAQPAPSVIPETSDLHTPHTILVAEDNESNYLLFRSILESRYKILHAYNGQEAVNMFRDNDVDLILMDINMPLKDGYEATREIRAISPNVPIVAVTAYAFTTDKQRIFENGFNAYISKPISINRLERVITSLLQA